MVKFVNAGPERACTLGISAACSSPLAVEAGMNDVNTDCGDVDRQFGEICGRRPARIVRAVASTDKMSYLVHNLNYSSSADLV